MNQEDRDRLKEIEIGVKALTEAINGDRGVVSRMDNHGDRLRKIETVMAVGAFAFTATGAALVYTKEIIVAWAKKKVGVS